VLLQFYIILVLLLWWTLQTVPLIEIWDAFKQLKLWQICVLLVLNALVLLAMTARWWVTVRAHNPNHSLSEISTLSSGRLRIALLYAWSAGGRGARDKHITGMTASKP
jgi:uncharacterized membrane protein YbhN (UPF0104 family)